nr:MAG TPA: hypothetical protein [Caudoviricetes sp.]
MRPSSHLQIRNYYMLLYHKSNRRQPTRRNAVLLSTDKRI